MTTSIKERFAENGDQYLIKAILPQGESEGFMLMYQPNTNCKDPWLVKSIVIELVHGEKQRFIVRRSPKIGTLEHVVAKLLTQLLANKSTLIRLQRLNAFDKEPVAYISYSDLAGQVNHYLSMEDVDPDKIASKAIGTICREGIGLKTFRMDFGWVIVIDEDGLNHLRAITDTDVELPAEEDQ